MYGSITTILLQIKTLKLVNAKVKAIDRRSWPRDGIEKKLTWNREGRS